jgi:hypothetical protein
MFRASNVDIRLLPPCAAGAEDWLEKHAFSANRIHSRRKVAGVLVQNENCREMSRFAFVYCFFNSHGGVSGSNFSNSAIKPAS